MSDVIVAMVNLTTTQVETFFGELEYIESRLEVLGVNVVKVNSELPVETLLII